MCSHITVGLIFALVAGLAIHVVDHVEHHNTEPSMYSSFDLDPTNAKRIAVRDGLLLHCQEIPCADPARVLVFVHDGGDHSGRYKHLASEFKHTAAAYLCDLRGHGRSQGRRFYALSYQEYVSDIHAIIQHVRQRHARVPLTLIGHGTGAVLATLAALPNSDAEGADATPSSLLPDSLILTSPCFAQGRLGIIPYQSLLADAVSFLLPYFELEAVPSCLRTANNQTDAQFDNDKYVFHGKIPVRTAVELRNAALAASRALSWLPMPVLVLHGDADRLCSFEASKAVAESAGFSFTTRTRGSRIRLFLSLVQGPHDLWHSTKAREVFDSIVEFFSALPT